MMYVLCTLGWANQSMLYPRVLWKESTSVRLSTRLYVRSLMYTYKSGQDANGWYADSQLTTDRPSLIFIDRTSRHVEK